MNPTYLIDSDVFLGLLAVRHSHRELCVRWYDSLGPGQLGLTRIVHLAALRMLGTRALMGLDVISAKEAWWRIDELLEDERVDFLPEPPALRSILPTLFRYQEPTPNLINDAYLAAFAIAGGHKLVTRDQGFRQFRGLEVEILGQ